MLRSIRSSKVEWKIKGVKIKNFVSFFFNNQVNDSLESTPYDFAAILEHHFCLSHDGKFLFFWMIYMFSGNIGVRLVKVIAIFILHALNFPNSSFSLNSISVPLLAIFFLIIYYWYCCYCELVLSICKPHIFVYKVHFFKKMLLVVWKFLFMKIPN